MKKIVLSLVLIFLFLFITTYSKNTKKIIVNPYTKYIIISENLPSERINTNLLPKFKLISGNRDYEALILKSATDYYSTKVNTINNSEEIYISVSIIEDSGFISEKLSMTEKKEEMKSIDYEEKIHTAIAEQLKKLKLTKKIVANASIEYNNKEISLIKIELNYSANYISADENIGKFEGLKKEVNEKMMQNLIKAVDNYLVSLKENNK